VLLHLRSLAPHRRDERLAMRAVGWVFADARRFAFAQRLGRLVQRPLLRAGALRPWTRTRDLKRIPAQTFREWWRNR
jgi:L-lactate dehydrogenase complex protein LldF